tara:strand:+ start:4027 stop:4248 length:222 start_codon:yes stop_codon:yes gene_type:complete
MPKIHLDQTILQTKTVGKICDYIRHTLQYVDVENEDARNTVLLGQYILNTHEKAKEKDTILKTRLTRNQANKI